MPSASKPPRPTRNAKQLMDTLAKNERATQDTREEIIRFIRYHMGDVTPYEFAAASGINRGNLYNLVSNGKWNATVVAQCMDLLATPISERERPADGNGDDQ